MAEDREKVGPCSKGHKGCQEIRQGMSDWRKLQVGLNTTAQLPEWIMARHDLDEEGVMCLLEGMKGMAEGGQAQSAITMAVLLGAWLEYRHNQRVGEAGELAKLVADRPIEASDTQMRHPLANPVESGGIDEYGEGGQ